MFITTVVLSVLLSVALAVSFIRKVTHAPPSTALRDRLAVKPELWQAIGIAEACAVAGLLAGLAFRPLNAAAAAGTALLMAGAIAAHLRRRITGRALAPPSALLALAVAVAALSAAA
jgi:hypothetical protein